MTCKDNFLTGVFDTLSAGALVGAGALTAAVVTGTTFVAAVTVGALPIAGCALIAIVAGRILQAVMHKCCPNYSGTGYFSSRLVVLLSVAGFAAAMGMAPIIPFVMMTVYFVRDLLFVGIVGDCRRMRQQKKDIFRPMLAEMHSVLENEKVSYPQKEGDKNIGENYGNDIYERCPESHREKLVDLARFIVKRSERVNSTVFIDPEAVKKILNTENKENNEENK